MGRLGEAVGDFFYFVKLKLNLSNANKITVIRILSYLPLAYFFLREFSAYQDELADARKVNENFKEEYNAQGLTYHRYPVRVHYTYAVVCSFFGDQKQYCEEDVSNLKTLAHFESIEESTQVMGYALLALAFIDLIIAIRSQAKTVEVAARRSLYSLLLIIEIGGILCASLSARRYDLKIGERCNILSDLCFPYMKYSMNGEGDTSCELDCSGKDDYDGTKSTCQRLEQEDASTDLYPILAGVVSGAIIGIVLPLLVLCYFRRYVSNEPHQRRVRTAVEEGGVLTPLLPDDSANSNLSREVVSSSIVISSTVHAPSIFVQEQIDTKIKNENN